MKKEGLAFAGGLLLAGLFAAVINLAYFSQNVTLYYHQIGIYENAENALASQKKVQDLGLDSYILHKDEQSIVIAGLTLAAERDKEVEETLKAAGFPLLAKQTVLTDALKKDLENQNTESVIEYLESR